MKKTILFLLTFVCLTSCYVTKVSQGNYPIPFQYSLLDSVQGASKNDIYVRAMEWIAKQFVSANSVIQMQDKDAGKIIGKGVLYIQTYYSSDWAKTAGPEVVRFTLTLDVKDGKYRCVLSDFAFAKEHTTNYISLETIYPGSRYEVRRTLDRKEQVQLQANEILKNLKEYMSNKRDNF